MNGDNVTHFDNFGVEHSQKEIRKFIGYKHIAATLYRNQANDSIMCGYIFIGFSDFMLKSKSLLNYENLKI